MKRLRKVFRQRTNIALALIGLDLMALQAPVCASSLDLNQQTYKEIEYKLLVDKSSSVDDLEHRVAKLIQSSPESAQVHYLMTLALLRTFYSEPTIPTPLRSSISIASQGIELEPRSEFGYLSTALVLEATAEFEQAKKLLVKSSSLYSPSWRWHHLVGRLEALTGNYAEAISQYQKALQKPDAFRSLIAIDLVESLIVKDEGSIDIALLRDLADSYPCFEFSGPTAEIYLRNGDLKSARIYASIAARQNPKSSLPILIQAQIELASKDFAMALNKLKRLEKFHLNKVQTTIRSRLLFEVMVGIKSDSITSAAIAWLKSEEESLSALNQMTEILSLNNQKRKILPILESVTQSLPQIAYAHAWLAEIYSDNPKTLQRGLKSFDRAVALEKGSSEIFGGRGLARFKVGRFSEAADDFEKSISLDPNNASSHYNLACALTKLRRYELALSSLKDSFLLSEDLVLQSKSDQDLEQLRPTEEYKKLIKEIESYDRMLAH